jgi:hypothetical protein
MAEFTPDENDYPLFDIDPADQQGVYGGDIPTDDFSSPFMPDVGIIPDQVAESVAALDDQTPPSAESKCHLLDLVTDELQAGVKVSEIGQTVRTVFPAGKNCKLDLYAYANGRVNPEKPNLLATVVRTDFDANRFIGPHELTSYDILIIPDGLLDGPKEGAIGVPLK